MYTKIKRLYIWYNKIVKQKNKRLIVDYTYGMNLIKMDMKTATEVINKGNASKPWNAT